jgi:hypothetical protein
MNTKQPKLHDFLTQMKIKANLIPTLDRELRKIRTITRHVQNKNLTIFYCKKGIN